jgi:hypothetical protein
VCLRERKLRVERPRLRKKGQGQDDEVAIPAYQAMQADQKLGARMLEILLRGVSSRQYKQVLPEMAETVGVSKSSVSQEAIAASEEEFRRRSERRFDQIDILMTEKSFRRMMGYRELWMLKAALDEGSLSARQPVEKVA